MKQWKQLLCGAACLTCLVAVAGTPLMQRVAEPTPAVVCATELMDGNFNYTVSGNRATVIGYSNGICEELIVPETLGGYPVCAIADGAFQLMKITKAVIPEGVTTLGGSAFSQCPRLTTVQLPDSLTEIGACAFDRCSQLRSVSIPDKVTKIGWQAFYGCKSLQAIHIPGGVVAMETGAFQSSGLTSVTFGEGIQEIGPYAFDETKLTSVSLPDSLTTIGTYAFRCCTGLTTVCIPKNVTAPMDYVFNKCTNLREITVSEENPNYCSLDGLVYSKDMTQLLICPFAYDKPVIIPDGVTTLADYVFKDHAKLPSVSFSEGSVTELSDYMFAGCRSLESVQLPDSLTRIGYDAFYGCSSLTSLTLPKNVNDVSVNAFPWKNKDWWLPDDEAICCNLREILVDDENETYYSVNGILYMKNGGAIYRCPPAFTGKVTLTHYRSPYAFNGCVGKFTLVIPDALQGYNDDELTEWEIDNYGDYATCVLRGIEFTNCTGLQAFEVSETHPTLSVVDGVLYNKEQTQLIKCPAGRTSLEPVSSTTEIFDFACHECIKLTKVVLPEGLQTISPSAFYDCKSLTDLTLPDSLKCICRCAFLGCDSLETVSLPDGLQSIGEKAFSGCYKIERIFVPRSVRGIGANAFYMKPDDPYIMCVNKGTVIYGYAGTQAELYCKNPNEEEEDYVERNQFCAVGVPQKLRQLCGNLITWTGTTENQYEIYLDGKLATTTANTTYAFQNLTPGQTYTVGVKPIREDGIDVEITSVQLTAVENLQRPKNLKREGSTLSWDAVPGAARYRVWVIDALTNTFVASNAQIYDTTYDFCTMRPGGYYRLRVCAIDENGVYGCSKTLAPFCYAPEETTAPGKLYQKHSNAILWNTVFGAVNYEIFVDGEKVTQTPNHMYYFQNLTAGTTYTVGVRAVFADGTVGKMAETPVTAVEMLDRPGSVNVNRNSVEWEAVTGAVSYRYWVIDAETNEYVAVACKAKSTAISTVRLLETGKRYKIRICAVDENGVFGKSVTTKVFVAHREIFTTSPTNQ